MSTTNIETWAVDLAEVTYLHPFVGSEGLLAIVGIVLWLGWHVWQCRFESAQYELTIRDHATDENIAKRLKEH